MESLITLAITTLVGAFVGSFLAGYLKKKGENLATHEDIDMLVGQMAAVTKATKEIEAKISDDVWDRQKRWELKRDAFFEATRRIADAKDALLRLHAFHTTEKKAAIDGTPLRPEERLKVGAAWLEAADRLDEAGWLVDLVCGKEVTDAIRQFSLFAREMAQDAVTGRPETFANSLKDFTNKMKVITAEMKKEMGL